MLLAELRTALRTDLKDEDSANYRWTDDELDRSIERALAMFSHYMPLYAKALVATVAGSHDISITALNPRYSVQAVEFPTGYFPPRFVEYAVSLDTLTMVPTGTGANCYIYWGTTHSVTLTASTLPAQYDNTILLGASAYAVMAWSQYGTNRANTGGETVDRDYLYWAKGRELEFTKELKRISKKMTRGELYADD